MHRMWALRIDGDSRVLSRGTSPAAQFAHFSGILSAAPSIPAVIYNSPYYGFETKADLFFALHKQHPNLVGFKEFGGSSSLTYAAEHITMATPSWRSWSAWIRKCFMALSGAVPLALSLA